MHIESVTCDVCRGEFSYPDGITTHKHNELDIGGVPMNIWTPNYNLPKGRLSVLEEHGILKFKNYLPRIKKETVDYECSTPLVELKNDKFQVLLKDEGKNPTGSFKDRGMPLLVSDAIYMEKKSIALPSTGNAAKSLVYYAKKADIEAILFVPESSIPTIQQEDGIRFVPNKDLKQAYENFFLFCRDREDVYNGFPVTNIPYSQGLKTLSYELYMDLEENIPDWVIMPCGSGGNVVSSYQGFLDLYDIGLINKLPKLVTVQIEGADPITVGFNNQQFNRVVVLDDPKDSRAHAIASDTCFNYHKIMRILQDTNGMAVSVTDSEIEAYQGKYDEFEFSSLSVFPALDKISDVIGENEKVVLVATAKSK